MGTETVRVRFAPSPTGPLHIGGVRTALYNYLFARQHGGKLILRIEDTDSSRFVEGAEEYILESFEWLGITFDEGVGTGGDCGPYRQSERRDIYKVYARRLYAEGKAYIAFDTPEELQAAREKTPNFQYDSTTRLGMRNSLTLPEDEVEKLMESGAQWVLRLKIEGGENVHVHDMIRGDVVINSSVLDDKVLYKSADRLPTYHLANVVDDHLMRVTHVIRGEEWLPSAPLHVLLYRALGWMSSMPRFAHLPLLLKPDGKGKLSKRDGDRLGFPVFPLEWRDPKSGEISAGFRENGYMPQAVTNFLALLGWNPGDDKELMPLAEIIGKFDIGHCSRSGAKFDFMKAQWFNHEYILGTPSREMAPEFRDILLTNGIDETIERAAQVVEMMKGRVNFVRELWPLCKFFFVAPESFDPKTVKKRWKPDSPRVMRELRDRLASLDDFSIESQESDILAWIADKGYGNGNVLNAFRLCIVGQGIGPHVFDISAFIGKEETLRRMDKAMETLSQTAETPESL